MFDKLLGNRLLRQVEGDLSEVRVTMCLCDSANGDAAVGRAFSTRRAEWVTARMQRRIDTAKRLGMDSEKVAYFEDRLAAFDWQDFDWEGFLAMIIEFIKALMAIFSMV